MVRIFRFWKLYAFLIIWLSFVWKHSWTLFRQTFFKIISINIFIAVENYNSKRMWNFVVYFFVGAIRSWFLCGRNYSFCLNLMQLMLKLRPPSRPAKWKFAFEFKTSSKFLIKLKTAWKVKKNLTNLQIMQHNTVLPPKSKYTFRFLVRNLFIHFFRHFVFFSRIDFEKLKRIVHSIELCKNWLVLFVSERFGMISSVKTFILLQYKTLAIFI